MYTVCLNCYHSKGAVMPRSGVDLLSNTLLWKTCNVSIDSVFSLYFKDTKRWSAYSGHSWRRKSVPGGSPAARTFIFKNFHSLNLCTHYRGCWSLQICVCGYMDIRIFTNRLSPCVSPITVSKLHQIWWCTWSLNHTQWLGFIVVSARNSSVHAFNDDRLQLQIWNGVPKCMIAVDWTCEVCAAGCPLVFQVQQVNIKPVVSSAAKLCRWRALLEDYSPDVGKHLRKTSACHLTDIARVSILCKSASDVSKLANHLCRGPRKKRPAWMKPMAKRLDKSQHAVHWEVCNQMPADLVCASFRARNRTSPTWYGHQKFSMKITSQRLLCTTVVIFVIGCMVVGAVLGAMLRMILWLLVNIWEPWTVSFKHPASWYELVYSLAVPISRFWGKTCSLEFWWLTRGTCKSLV